MADQSSLTLDTLRALSPISADGKDIVTLASRDVILSSIKMNAHVRDIFFPDANDQPNCKLDAKLVFAPVLLLNLYVLVKRITLLLSRLTLILCSSLVQR